MLKLGVQLHLTPALSKACHPQSTKEQCPIYTFSGNRSTIIPKDPEISNNLLRDFNNKTHLSNHSCVLRYQYLTPAGPGTTLSTVDVSPHERGI